MSSSVMANINFFFTPPSTPPIIPGTFSQLYLLRRDISSCFGIDPNTDQMVQSPVLFPGVMCICAGIDLLGKFLAGSDAQGGVGPRFKSFLTTCFGISANDADIIYQLRNSLLYSFGLYSETTVAGHLVQYRFTLARRVGALITPSAGTNYAIDIDTFRTEFEKAIANYEARLLASAPLQANFSNMFPKHSTIPIN